MSKVNEIEAVRKFHEKFGFLYSDTPTLHNPSFDEQVALRRIVEILQVAQDDIEDVIEKTFPNKKPPIASRICLMLEEFTELAYALTYPRGFYNIMKEACDVSFTFFGLFVKLGLGRYYDACFKAVTEENMSKTKQENGMKPLKGENFKPANIEKVIKKIDKELA